MSIPLAKDNSKDSINTSIIAIKRQIERINALLGLSNSEEIDTSVFATKTELEDAVTQVETDLAPVDEVAVDNMQSVTSNGVANALGSWEELWKSGTNIIKGLTCNGVNYVAIHLQSFACTSNYHIITTIPSKYRPKVVTRGLCFSAENPLRMAYINIENDGSLYISNMNGKTVYGDSFVMIEKDV